MSTRPGAGSRGRAARRGTQCERRQHMAPGSRCSQDIPPAGAGPSIQAIPYGTRPCRPAGRCCNGRDGHTPRVAANRRACRGLWQTSDAVAGDRTRHRMPSSSALSKSASTSSVRCPDLHRDWAHPCHICTGTGLAPAASSPGLHQDWAPLPNLHRDWNPCGHILHCAFRSRRASERLRCSAPTCSPLLW